MSKHCATCTCSSSMTTVFCNSEASLNAHETFGCLEYVDTDGQHPMPHKGMILADEKCPTCGGYESHAEGCRDMALMATTSKMVEVQWGEDGVVTLVPWGR